MHAKYSPFDRAGTMPPSAYGSLGAHLCEYSSFLEGAELRYYLLTGHLKRCRNPIAWLNVLKGAEATTPIALLSRLGRGVFDSDTEKRVLFAISSGSTFGTSPCSLLL